MYLVFDTREERIITEATTRHRAQQLADQITINLLLPNNRLVVRKKEET